MNPLGDAETDRDLDAVMGQAPFAIVLPQALKAGIQQLSAKLAVREALGGLEDGSTGIIAVADPAAALIGLAGARDMSARLIGLAWDAEALRAEIGAGTCRDESGASMPDPMVSPATSRFSRRPQRASRRSTRPRPASRDREGLRAEAFAAWRDGFDAKLAADPDQAKIINEVFRVRC